MPPLLHNQFHQDFLDITLIKDGEFEAAFARVDRDNSGFITPDEFRELLTITYHGPPPESEVDRLMEAFDTNRDGKVSMEEFVTTIKRLKAELEEKARRRAVGAEPVHGEISYAQLQQDKARGRRAFEGPRELLHHPVTAAQDYGWTAKEGRVRHEIHPRKKCEETKFGEKMFASGEFFL